MPKKIKVEPTDPKYPTQSRLEYNPVHGENWKENYILLSGYCGPHGPHVFAAAPELLQALIEIEALDPEHLVDRCAELCLHGLVNRMGEIARAAIAETKGE